MAKQTGSSAKGQDARRTWIKGTGFQDPPTTTPAHPASKSTVRILKYGSTGRKS